MSEYCKAGGVTVLPTGIWLLESCVLGASTDGFVQGDFLKSPIVHHQQKNQPPTLPAIIEVKCPFTAKDLTIVEACSSIKEFFLAQLCLLLRECALFEVYSRRHQTAACQRY